MVNVHDGHENQEASGEIVMEDVADEPGAGNELRDAARQERDEIYRHTPIRLAARSRFATLVVTGDPQILRGMQDGENSAAVARLRNLVGRAQFEKRGQNEPEKLGDREGERREHLSNAVLADHSLKTQPSEKCESCPQCETHGKSKLRWYSQ